MMADVWASRQLEDFRRVISIGAIGFSLKLSVPLFVCPSTMVSFFIGALSKRRMGVAFCSYFERFLAENVSMNFS